MTQEVWLASEVSDGFFACQGFSGVPAGRSSWITLVSSGSAAARGHVDTLGKEIEAVLLGSSPDVTSAPMAVPAEPSAMRPEDFPDRRKVLVLVAAADRPFEDVPWFNHWQSDAHDAVVMTVLPPGPYDTFFAPAIREDRRHLLQRINASTWKDGVAESLPAVLARAEVTSASTRVFISYRRLDTLPVALQLFDQLTYEGFEVFLDRFSIPPGHDFQRRLAQDLEDKSMVLLLESRFIADSMWTQHEIDFAKRHRLGLLAVTMPDVEPAAAMRSINFDARLVMGSGDFVRAPARSAHPTRPGVEMNEWPPLTDATRDRVVAEFKRAHAAALFRRRHRLRGDLVAELKRRSLHIQHGAVGPLRVRSGAALEEHLVWLTTRPPEVEDFRLVHRAHAARPGAPQSRAIIIGPEAALEPDRQERLKWLREVSRCLSFDEGNLADVARRLEQGDFT